MDDNNSYRYERKFLIDGTDRYTVERIIRSNTQNLKTLFPPRRINNIYFDDIEMHAFHDNLEGITNRRKFRIRWYGNDIYGLIHKPVLEIKIRNNSVGMKEKYSLPPISLNNKTSHLDIREILLKSNIPSIRKEELMRLSPKLVNGYSRKYLISSDKKYRLTLDNDLFYIKSNQRKIFSNYKITNTKSTVMEIKYNRDDDDKISKLTSQFDFRLTKNSKYVNGVYKLYF